MRRRGNEYSSAVSTRSFRFVVEQTAEACSLFDPVEMPPRAQKLQNRTWRK